jgi:hypothetical protein
MRKGLSGGKRYGPPPERGPNPQGIKETRFNVVLRCVIKIF